MRLFIHACVYVCACSCVRLRAREFVHGRRSVVDRGDASPHFSAWGDSIGIVPSLFSSEKSRGI